MVLGRVVGTSLLVVSLIGCQQATEHQVSPADIDWADLTAIIARSLPTIPLPPWPAGDQRGMANTLGTGTWQRCAYHLGQANARIYDLAFTRSNDMPQSPWAPPLKFEYGPTSGFPGTIHAWHPGVMVIGEPGAQGTQMDGIGHWGYLPEPWDGSGEFAADSVRYYGGFTQTDVKPSPDSPLMKLGIEQVPPIITSAVLLDARTRLGGGAPMQAGQQVTAADIEQMIESQGLGWRGMLAGDVVYIYTGWSDYWNEDFYYDKGPGLSYDAARYLEDKRVVLVALDNPFTDAVNEGQFFGGAEPPNGTPPGMSTPVHHHNLTQAGIHNIQNANLSRLAEDKVWLSCTIIVPLSVQGGSTSPIRPIAVGTGIEPE